MDTIKQTLNTYGQRGVNALRQDVQKVSATGKTADSIRYEVSFKEGVHTLAIIGRQFFKALETGRGPRTNSEYQGFDQSLLEYMQARGIGSDLPENKRNQLAKFLALKINKEGDRTYKQGGRQVYSKTLDKLVKELIEAIKDDLRILAINKIIKEPLKAA